ncbi:hypothetical protein [Chitinophaga sp. XS-30]|uniref:hypothetical protein n=1 Tax=Chitinophaga sp. XS-30 TaxID=2604421 RepID=UPI0011DC740A|nr:hypothetical protein [Chitinophaga sp. XS-30]QEH39417.1 hypothetical protein FW415_00430 [Chitinophaga sp. XS-30]
MEQRYQYPQIIQDMFPLIFISYKPKRSRQRRRRNGVEVVQGKQFVRGWGFRATYGKFRKTSTNNQNDFSFVTCLVLSPDGYGTVRRSLKHKGYSKLVAAIYPTDEEIEREKGYFRYIFRKYKTAGEIYNYRQFDHPEWKSICERLDADYPSHSSGQLRLF